MSTPAWVRSGTWRIWTDPVFALAPDEWLATVERLLASGRSLHRSKHADTYRWARSGGDVYVKVYRRYRRWTAFKDWFRPTKAANVLAMSLRLSDLGFLVPRVLAVGEERTRGGGRSWCATAALGGEPVATRLAALAAAPEPGGDHTALRADHTALRADHTALRAKRGMLTSLGREVARLHQQGVVPGDLVPANVWIALAAAELRIAFLDHDRTRVGTAPTAWRRARRNLVQLNRVVLTGVTTSDRLRVFRAYADAAGWSRSAARRRLPWIIAKTLARRRAERSVVPIPRDADFRAVMRANGPYALSPSPQRYERGEPA